MSVIFLRCGCANYVCAKPETLRFEHKTALLNPLRSGMGIEHISFDMHRDECYARDVLRGCGSRGLHGVPYTFPGIMSVGAHNVESSLTVPSCGMGDRENESEIIKQLY